MTFALVKHETSWTKKLRSRWIKSFQRATTHEVTNLIRLANQCVVDVNQENVDHIQIRKHLPVVSGWFWMNMNNSFLKNWINNNTTWQFRPLVTEIVNGIQVFNVVSIQICANVDWIQNMNRSLFQKFRIPKVTTRISTTNRNITTIQFFQCQFTTDDVRLWRRRRKWHSKLVWQEYTKQTYLD